jgi:hypothetical protein
MFETSLCNKTIFINEESPANDPKRAWQNNRAGAAVGHKVNIAQSLPNKPD